MYKALLTIGLMLQMNFPLACLAQGPTIGAAILLNNHDSDHPIFYGTIGNPAAGGDFYVQILGGPDADHLQPVASHLGSPNIFHIGMTIDGLVDGPGFFDYGMGIVPGVIPSANATFEVYAWKGAPTFETASQRVMSGLFTQKTGESVPLDPPSPAVFEFPAGLVIPAVPEPSVVTLVVLGALGWFVVGRCR